MWSKRKSKRNRRFEREHILDVKVESRQLRAQRLRLCVRIFARVFGTATVLFLIWRGGDWLLDELVFKNPSFAVQEIDVETDGILSKPQLRAWSGVRIGDNLLGLDLNRVQRDLEYLPWIQSVAVERVRPHTLRIRVVEREPIAQTNLLEPGGPDGRPRNVVFYLDAHGQVMLPLDAQRFDTAALGFDALPTLTGVAGVELRPGHLVESTQIQAALRFLAEFNRSAMLGVVDIDSIDVATPQLLEISTRQAAVITLSVDNLEVQLRRWRLVHDYAVGKGIAIASLDFSVANNVPARWLETAVTIPPRSKLNKPSPYKKKHV